MQRSASPSKMTPQSSPFSRTAADSCSRASASSGFGRGVTRRPSGPELERSIDRLTDPKDNSIHEKAAKLAAALARYFPPEQLPAYTLTGKAGAPKRIRLDRSLVEWE